MSNSESDERCFERKSRLGQCEVCVANDAKYCCPKCEVKSCSISCLNIHKKELDCNGVRDKVKFMPLKEMTETEFLRDYTFLEECTRYLSDRKRDKLKRYTRFNKNLPMHLCKLRLAANDRNIRLKFLLQLFSKHKSNTTFYDWNEKVIYWHVDWHFPMANDEIFADDRCCEQTQLSGLLEKYFDAKNAALKNLDYYRSRGIGSVTVLLKAEGIKRSKDRYFQLDINKTLNENLMGKTIVEYPSIYVIYKENESCFDVIDSDDDIEMETQLYQKELNMSYGNKSKGIVEESETNQLNDEQMQKKIEQLEIEKKRKARQCKREKRQDQPQNFLFMDENDSDTSTDRDSANEEEPLSVKKVKQ